MTNSAILVVEDNPEEVDLIREAMAEAVAGVTVTILGTVGDALEWLALRPADAGPLLVLTDHHLPDRPGHELIAAIRAAPSIRHLPVVMVSGDGDRPAGLDGTDWYGKPETWNGWCALARLLVERHLPRA